MTPEVWGATIFEGDSTGQCLQFFDVFGCSFFFLFRHVVVSISIPLVLLYHSTSFYPSSDTPIKRFTVNFAFLILLVSLLKVSYCCTKKPRKYTFNGRLETELYEGVFLHSHLYVYLFTYLLGTNGPVTFRVRDTT